MSNVSISLDTSCCSRLCTQSVYQGTVIDLDMVDEVLNFITLNLHRYKLFSSQYTKICIQCSKLTKPVYLTDVTMKVAHSKLEILISLGGFYDGLAFSPTGLNRFDINSLPPHYRPTLSTFYVFILHFLYLCPRCQLFYNMGWRAPKRGLHISTFFHPILIS